MQEGRHIYQVNRQSAIEQNRRASIGPYVASIEGKTEKNHLLENVHKVLFYSGIFLFIVLLDGLFKWQMWSASISIIR